MVNGDGGRKKERGESDAMVVGGNDDGGLQWVAVSGGLDIGFSV